MSNQNSILFLLSDFVSEGFFVTGGCEEAGAGGLELGGCGAGAGPAAGATFGRFPGGSSTGFFEAGTTESPAGFLDPEL